MVVMTFGVGVVEAYMTDDRHLLAEVIWNHRKGGRHCRQEKVREKGKMGEVR